MQELKELLAKRELANVLKFNPLRNRVRCYAHIINICSSHVVASFTSVPKSYLTDLNVPLDADCEVYDASNCDDQSHLSDNDDDDLDPNDQADYTFNLPGCYRSLNNSNSKQREWAETIKRDPLRRARRVIRILRSSDDHRLGLSKLIEDGNKSGLFTTIDPHTKGDRRVPAQVPNLQLLRDVKTRWDSVYLMLWRLRVLQPVRWLWLILGQRSLTTT
jgi:hypothetical protein